MQGGGLLAGATGGAAACRSLRSPPTVARFISRQPVEGTLLAGRQILEGGPSTETCQGTRAADDSVLWNVGWLRRRSVLPTLPSSVVSLLVIPPPLGPSTVLSCLFASASGSRVGCLLRIASLYCWFVLSAARGHDRITLQWDGWPAEHWVSADGGVNFVGEADKGQKEPQGRAGKEYSMYDFKAGAQLMSIVWS